MLRVGRGGQGGTGSSLGTANAAAGGLFLGGRSGQRTGAALLLSPSRRRHRNGHKARGSVKSFLTKFLYWGRKVNVDVVWIRAGRAGGHILEDGVQ